MPSTPLPAVPTGTARLAYDRDAVLTVAEVAAWLRKSERTIYRMGIRRNPQGLIVAQWVYDYLEESAA